jgi:hypothetical protein
MSCSIRSEEHTDQLLAYSAGKLRGDAAAKLELHMRTCADCAAIGESQSAVWNLLDTWEARPVSADFNRRLYERIDAAASASWWDKMVSSLDEFLRPVFARPAFPLAAASLIIVAGFVLDHPGRMGYSHKDQGALEATASGPEINKLEVDQVEATLDDMEMLRQFDAKAVDTGKEKHSKSM